MPLADKTAVNNLALDLIGEPYLEDLDTDAGTTAECCRLHFPQALETVLEGHVWSFATRCSQLTEALVAETTAVLAIDQGGDENAFTLTAKSPGPSGNEITFRIAPVSDGALAVDVLGNAITVTPQRKLQVGGSWTSDGATLYLVAPLQASPDPTIWSEDGSATPPASGQWLSLILSEGVWTLQLASYAAGDLAEVIFSFEAVEGDTSSPLDAGAFVPNSPATGTPVLSPALSSVLQVVDAINADEFASLLVTAAMDAGNDGLVEVSLFSVASLAGGISGSSVYAPAYGSAFLLPSDCLRLIKLDGADVDHPLRRFELQGRFLLIEEANAPAPVIHYITNDPPVNQWPTTFADAVATLQAARIAPKLTQNPAITQSLEAKHEMLLGKARSKDARETRSAENFGPRQLAARSGFVNARFGRFAGSSAPAVLPSIPMDGAVSDWSEEIE